MCCTPSGGSSNDTRDNCATLTSKTSNVDGLDRLPQDHEQHGFTPVKPTTAVTTTSTAAMAVAITLQLRQLPRKETIDNTGHHYDGSRSLSIHSQTRSKTSSSSFGRCQTPPSTAWMKGFMGWCFWSWITLTLLESDFGHCHFRLHCYYCQALTTTSPPSTQSRHLRNTARRSGQQQHQQEKHPFAVSRGTFPFSSSSLASTGWGEFFTASNRTMESDGRMPGDQHHALFQTISSSPPHQYNNNNNNDTRDPAAMYHYNSIPNIASQQQTPLHRPIVGSDDYATAAGADGSSIANDHQVIDEYQRQYNQFFTVNHDVGDALSPTVTTETTPDTTTTTTPTTMQRHDTILRQPIKDHPANDNNDQVRSNVNGKHNDSKYAEDQDVNSIRQQQEQQQRTTRPPSRRRWLQHPLSQSQQQQPVPPLSRRSSSSLSSSSTRQSLDRTLAQQISDAILDGSLDDIRRIRDPVGWSSTTEAIPAIGGGWKHSSITMEFPSPKPRIVQDPLSGSFVVVPPTGGAYGGGGGGGGGGNDGSNTPNSSSSSASSSKSSIPPTSSPQPPVLRGDASIPPSYNKPLVGGDVNDDADAAPSLFRIVVPELLHPRNGRYKKDSSVTPFWTNSYLDQLSSQPPLSPDNPETEERVPENEDGTDDETVLVNNVDGASSENPSLAGSSLEKPTIDLAIVKESVDQANINTNIMASLPIEENSTKPASLGFSMDNRGMTNPILKNVSPVKDTGPNPIMMIPPLDGVNRSPYPVNISAPSNDVEKTNPFFAPVPLEVTSTNHPSGTNFRSVVTAPSDEESSNDRSSTNAMAITASSKDVSSNPPLIIGSTLVTTSLERGDMAIVDASTTAPPSTTSTSDAIEAGNHKGNDDSTRFSPETQTDMVGSGDDNTNTANQTLSNSTYTHASTTGPPSTGSVSSNTTGLITLTQMKGIQPEKQRLSSRLDRSKYIRKQNRRFAASRLSRPDREVLQPLSAPPEGGYFHVMDALVDDIDPAGVVEDVVNVDSIDTRSAPKDHSTEQTAIEAISSRSADKAWKTITPFNRNQRRKMRHVFDRHGQTSSKRIHRSVIMPTTLVESLEEPIANTTVDGVIIQEHDGMREPDGVSKQRSDPGVRPVVKLFPDRDDYQVPWNQTAWAGISKKDLVEPFDSEIVKTADPPSKVDSGVASDESNDRRSMPNPFDVASGDRSKLPPELGKLTMSAADEGALSINMGYIPSETTNKVLNRKRSQEVNTSGEQLSKQIGSSFVQDAAGKGKYALLGADHSDSRSNTVSNLEAEDILSTIGTGVTSKKRTRDSGSNNSRSKAMSGAVATLTERAASFFGQWKEGLGFGSTYDLSVKIRDQSDQIREATASFFNSKRHGEKVSLMDSKEDSLISLNEKPGVDLGTIQGAAVASLALSTLAMGPLVGGGVAVAATLLATRKGKAGDIVRAVGDVVVDVSDTAMQRANEGRGKNLTIGVARVGWVVGTGVASLAMQVSKDYIDGKAAIISNRVRVGILTKKEQREEQTRRRLMQARFDMETAERIIRYSSELEACKKTARLAIESARRAHAKEDKAIKNEIRARDKAQQAAVDYERCCDSVRLLNLNAMMQYRFSLESGMRQARQSQLKEKAFAQALVELSAREKRFSGNSSKGNRMDSSKRYRWDSSKGNLPIGMARLGWVLGAEVASMMIKVSLDYVDQQAAFMRSRMRDRSIAERSRRIELRMRSLMQARFEIQTKEKFRTYTQQAENLKQIAQLATDNEILARKAEQYAAEDERQAKDVAQQAAIHYQYRRKIALSQVMMSMMEYRFFLESEARRAQQAKLKEEMLAKALVHIAMQNQLRIRAELVRQLQDAIRRKNSAEAERRQALMVYRFMLQESDRAMRRKEDKIARSRRDVRSRQGLMAYMLQNAEVQRTRARARQAEIDYNRQLGLALLEMRMAMLKYRFKLEGDAKVKREQERVARIQELALLAERANVLEREGLMLYRFMLQESDRAMRRKEDKIARSRRDVRSRQGLMAYMLQNAEVQRTRARARQAEIDYNRQLGLALLEMRMAMLKYRFKLEGDAKVKREQERVARIQELALLAERANVLEREGLMLYRFMLQESDRAMRRKEDKIARSRRDVRSRQGLMAYMLQNAEVQRTRARARQAEIDYNRQLGLALLEMRMSMLKYRFKLEGDAKVKREQERVARIQELALLAERANVLEREGLMLYRFMLQESDRAMRRKEDKIARSRRDVRSRQGLMAYMLQNAEVQRTRARARQAEIDYNRQLGLALLEMRMAMLKYRFKLEGDAKVKREQERVARIQELALLAERSNVLEREGLMLYRFMLQESDRAMRRKEDKIERSRRDVRSRQVLMAYMLQNAEVQRTRARARQAEIDYNRQLGLALLEMRMSMLKYRFKLEGDAKVKREQERVARIQELALLAERSNVLEREGLMLYRFMLQESDCARRRWDEMEAQTRNEVRDRQAYLAYILSDARIASPMCTRKSRLSTPTGFHLNHYDEMWDSLAFTDTSSFLVLPSDHELYAIRRLAKFAARPAGFVSMDFTSLPMHYLARSRSRTIKKRQGRLSPVQKLAVSLILATIGFLSDSPKATQVEKSIV